MEQTRKYSKEFLQQFIKCRGDTFPTKADENTNAIDINISFDGYETDTIKSRENKSVELSLFFDTLQVKVFYEEGIETEENEEVLIYREYFIPFDNIIEIITLMVTDLEK